MVFDLLILALYVGVLASLYLLVNRIFGRGEIEIQEQSRHEHLHTLHRKKDK